MRWQRWFRCYLSEGMWAHTHLAVLLRSSPGAAGAPAHALQEDSPQQHCCRGHRSTCMFSGGEALPQPTQHVVRHHTSVAGSALGSWCIYFPCCQFSLKAFQRFILDFFFFFFKQKSLEHPVDSAFHLLTSPPKALQSQDNTEADNFCSIRLSLPVSLYFFFFIKLTNGTKRQGRKEIFNLQWEVIFLL